MYDNDADDRLLIVRHADDAYKAVRAISHATINARSIPARSSTTSWAMQRPLRATASTKPCPRWPTGSCGRWKLTTSTTTPATLPRTLQPPRLCARPLVLPRRSGRCWKKPSHASTHRATTALTRRDLAPLAKHLRLSASPHTMVPTWSIQRMLYARLSGTVVSPNYFAAETAPGFLDKESTEAGAVPWPVPVAVPREEKRERGKEHRTWPSQGCCQESLGDQDW